MKKLIAVALVSTLLSGCAGVKYLHGNVTKMTNEEVCAAMGFSMMNGDISRVTELKVEAEHRNVDVNMCKSYFEMGSLKYQQEAAMANSAVQAMQAQARTDAINNVANSIGNQNINVHVW